MAQDGKEWLSVVNREIDLWFSVKFRHFHALKHRFVTVSQRSCVAMTRPKTCSLVTDKPS